MQTPYEILLRFSLDGKYQGGHYVTQDSETGRPSKAAPISDAQWPELCATINAASLARVAELEASLKAAVESATAAAKDASDKAAADLAAAKADATTAAAEAAKASASAIGKAAQDARLEVQGGLDHLVQAAEAAITAGDMDGIKEVLAKAQGLTSDARAQAVAKKRAELQAQLDALSA